MNRPSRGQIAVIGGGITGIAAALRLARSGLEVTLFEKEARLGGLSSSFEGGGVRWDRFYHVVLSTDTVLIGFLRELGLEDELVFSEAETGFFGRGRLVPLSSVKDFVSFPFLSLWQKARLAFGLLYSSGLPEVSALEKRFVREWLTKVFGRRLYEQIWDPLLRSKFGDARERTSAAFMAATIKRLYGARDARQGRERMGHVRGGYRTILGAAESRLRSLGARLRLGDPAVAVESSDRVSVRTREGVSRFDAAVLTVPCPSVLGLLGGTAGPYWDSFRSVEYLSVVCVALVLRRRLSRFYVTNLLDPGLPFTGIVEVSNLLAPEELGGFHLVYLPRYCTAATRNDAASDDDIVREALAGLRVVHPDLAPGEIAASFVFREPYVQPLLAAGRPFEAGVRTPVPGVYVANTAMIRNTTLNNNAAVALAGRASAAVLEDLGVCP